MRSSHQKDKPATNAHCPKELGFSVQNLINSPERQNCYCCPRSQTEVCACTGTSLLGVNWKTQDIDFTKKKKRKENKKTKRRQKERERVRKREWERERERGENQIKQKQYKRQDTALFIWEKNTTFFKQMLKMDITETYKGVRQREQKRMNERDRQTDRQTDRQRQRERTQSEAGERNGGQGGKWHICSSADSPVNLLEMTGTFGFAGFLSFPATVCDDTTQVIGSCNMPRPCLYTILHGTSFPGCGKNQTHSREKHKEKTMGGWVGGGGGGG